MQAASLLSQGTPRRESKRAGDATGFRGSIPRGLRTLSVWGYEAGSRPNVAQHRQRAISLDLAGCNCSPDAIRVLAWSPALARLNRLDLSYNYNFLRGDALLPLAESEYLSPLCELDIRGCHPDPEVRDALRARLGRRLRE